MRREQAASPSGGPPSPPPPGDLAARVARLRAEVTALVALDPVVDGATGPALHAELRTAAGQLHAFAARILARVEADGRWSAGSTRTFPDWMARRRLASTGSVRREVALGRALDESLPRTARAVATGEVSVEHAEVLARVAATSDARRAALACDDPGLNEASLLDRARRMPVDAYRREVARWATQVDVATAEAEHDAACAKEYLTFARRRDGVALQGFVTVEHATVLATALRSVAGVPSRGDTRSREERQAAALVDAGRLILDRGLSGGGQQVRPHLIVHVPVETLRAVEVHGADDPAHLDGLPPARLADGEPVSPTTLARLACDGELSRVVFGADSAPLDVGRAQRTYTGPQRLAVIARDESCRFPGCGAPLAFGEVHHVTPWVPIGRTSVANGVLLCWFHHALVHRRGIRVRRVAGAWEFRRADGSPVDEAAVPVDTSVGAVAGGDPPGPEPSRWGGPADRGATTGSPDAVRRRSKTPLGSPRPTTPGPQATAVREGTAVRNGTPVRNGTAVQEELALPP